MGALGGTLMALALLCYFIVFFATLLGGADSEPYLDLPEAEALHDEDVPAVRNFTPWVVAAIVLLIVAYTPPLYEVLAGPTQPAPGYLPSSPIPAAP